MFQRRVVGLVLTSIAMVLILFTVLSHRWWSAKTGDGSVNVGLRSVEVCDEDRDYDSDRTREECKTTSLGKTFGDDEDEDEDRDSYSGYSDYDSDHDERPRKKEPSGFIMLGNLTFFGGIVTGVLLLICAGAVLMSPHARASKGLGTAAAIASGAYAGSALLYVVMAPDQLEYIPLGMALPLALIAGGTGLGGALVLGNYDPATEPRPMPTAMLTGLAPSRLPVLILSGIGILLVMAAIFTNTWWGYSRDEGHIGMGVREAESCYKDTYGDYGDYDSDRRTREKCTTYSLKMEEERSSDYDDEDRDRGSQKMFLRAGAATYHVGIIACMLALIGAALIATNQKLPGPIAPANLLVGASAIFLLAALIFLASKPSQMKELKMSFGPVLALTGGGLLIAAGVVMSRFMPPGMTASPQAWMPPGVMGTPIGVMGAPMGAPMPMGTPLGTPMGGPMPMAAPLQPLAAVPTPVTDHRSGPVIPACPQCMAPMGWVAQHNRWFCNSCRVYA